MVEKGTDSAPTKSPALQRGRARPAGAVVVTVVAALALVAAVVTRHDGVTGRASAPSGFELAAEVSPLPAQIGLREGWNSSAFINDNLWTESDLQFAVWVDPDGKPIVGRRRGGEPWRTVNLGELPDNPFDAPTVPDPHNVFAVGVDEAGYVHVAGNMHGDPLRYVRSREPFDIDEWMRPRMVGSNEERVSYPVFVRAPGGALLFFYRDGISGRGDILLNRLDAATESWRRIGTLIDGRSSGESPYLQRVAVDSVRRSIHVMFLWRSGSDAVTNRDVSYLRSDDGGITWRASDTSVLRLPVSRQTADVVARTGGRSPVLLNQGALAIDDAGRPHAVFRAVTGTSARPDAIHIWQERDGWRTEPVAGTAAMVGRPALLGGGAQPLLLLWLEREADDYSDLRVARLSGGGTTGSISLARLPVTRWEPTFDSAAVDRGQLRMLLPVDLVEGSESAAFAAVVTWSVAALASSSATCERIRCR